MSIPARLVLATGNAGKLREMREILAPWQVDVRSLAEFTPESAAETGLTFVENALLKARFAARVAGLPAIADDSGLEVDALHGAPGIYSARYAGPACDDAANNAKLLRELEPVADAARTARYRCAMVYLRWPGVIREPEKDLQPVQSAALELLHETVRELNESRAREGGRLREMLNEFWEMSRPLFDPEGFLHLSLIHI